MASVYQRPGSPFWWAAFRDPDGRRVARSTKQKAKSAALKVAMEWDKAAEHARAKTLTEEQARRVVSDILERVGGQRLNAQSCREWLQEWISIKKGAVAEKSLEKYEQVTDDFLKHLGARADLPLVAIGTKDILGFRDALHVGGRTAGTVNQVVRKVLSAPFFKAARLGYISMNPCAAIEPLKERRSSESRAPFTSEQIGRLLATAENDWRGVILCAYTTGLRLRDITDMQWRSIDLEARTIQLRMKKNDREIFLPIHTDFETWLRAQPRGISKAPVFPKLFGKKTGGNHGLSGRFREIMDRAGIKPGIASQSGKRTTSRLSFHSLRHSFVSGLANAGVTKELRQKLAGHLDDRSHEAYTHHEIETLREAVAKLPLAVG